MKLCVTGGAGYIGSVVSERLVAQGHDVVIIDNLSTGHADAVPKGCCFVEGDIRQAQDLKKVLSPDIEGVLHFAASSIVEQSVKYPLLYFDNNVGGTIQLLEVMRKFRIRSFVFSSSAAVYGEPAALPIEETAECKPTNPYGFTKLFVEMLLESHRASWGLGYVALRYFNAGGSTATLGEHHDPESHLIPIVLDVAAGRREKFMIFGDDYETRDGTCLRDYIHVLDLAEAHVLALDAIAGGFAGPLNLGSESAFSVREVVEAVEKVTGKKVNHQVGPRRPGDPATLLASSKEAEKVLGWTKQPSTLEEIVRSSWEWRLQHPDGYAR